MGASAPSQHDVDRKAVEELSDSYQKICNELKKVIVGQDKVIEELLTCIFSRGHALLVGVPGLAKTLLVSSLSQLLSLKFNRIQFTPDLMPSDITGTEVIAEDKATGERHFKFLQGPLFAHILLADEINRTPPKTQAALLEAMQEKKVTIGGEDHLLEEPFFVLATQNPIEQEGTYPLPEAQLDRFMFNIMVDYPTDDEEFAIMQMVTSQDPAELSEVISQEQILHLQSIVKRVPVADEVLHYAKAISRRTRPKSEESPDFIKRWLTWGAGPRASLNMILAAKARAILHGQYHVSFDDIDAVAHPVLRHRIIPTFTAQSEGIQSDDVIDKLLDSLKDFKYEVKS
ncbi:MAG: MoxR family ATPase [Planctomycetota bacterium]|jgi:MoxR-like ATPase|nr:MoxR family ATPase [Planctomycetota bacterium]MDP7252561.1 MoxR family ATPase [Planctomycetota bacterium]